MVFAVFCLFPFAAQGHASEVFRIGFSASMFGEVNENDAMASVRMWSQAFVQERNLSAIPQPVVFKNVREIKTALTNKTVEALNLTIIEYAETQELLAKDVVIAGVIGDSITEEYVLLVKRKGNIKKLSDLEGRSLGMLNSIRASLASVWLDTLLIREGLKPADSFFAKINSNPKVGKVLLSVFFGQLDACVATRRGFDTMVELNPQTGQQLEVLAVSPSLIPTIFCFRKGYDTPLRSQILDEINRWHLTPAGQQNLTIFQTDSLKDQPVSCLDSSLELLRDHKQLLDGAGVTPENGDKALDGAAGDKKQIERQQLHGGKIS